MVSYYTIITLLLIHWIFDFHLQTDEMSKNKSKSNWALCEHVFIYTMGLGVMAVLNISYFVGHLGNWSGGVFVLINCVAHFLTDWVTSRATSALYEKERYHDFFVVIGADQMIHYITLFGTFVWLTNL
jgi:uncharacterized membrane protein